MKWRRVWIVCIEKLRCHKLQTDRGQNQKEKFRQKQIVS